MEYNRRRYLATVVATASALTIAGCSGNSNNSDGQNTETNGNSESNLFAELEGRELTWNGECPPANYEVAESIASAPSNAGYTVEEEATGSEFQTARGEQQSSGASALYSVRDEVPLDISIDIWDSAEIASNVADEVDRLGRFWRGESVTFEGGILAHISDSPVTAEFRTLNNDYDNELVEFYLTVPCFTASDVVDTSW